MNPGATIRPLASMTRAADAPSMRSTAAILPLTIPTSRRARGAPLPSTTSPPVIRRSKSATSGVELFASRLGQQLPGHPEVAGEQSTVNAEHRARDPGCLGGSEEHRGVGNVVGFAHAAKRIPLDQALEDNRVAVDSLLPDRRPDGSRRDGVAANA